eukprot:8502-Pyramimonas_sp.AAC.1
MGAVLARVARQPSTGPTRIVWPPCSHRLAQSTAAQALVEAMALLLSLGRACPSTGRMSNK